MTLNKLGSSNYKKINNDRKHYIKRYKLESLRVIKT